MCQIVMTLQGSSAVSCTQMRCSTLLLCTDLDEHTWLGEFDNPLLHPYAFMTHVLGCVIALTPSCADVNEHIGHGDCSNLLMYQDALTHLAS